MMTPKHRHRFGPILLATIGISVMLGGIGLHWWYEYRGRAHTLEWIPQIVGACIAFAGFYAMYPKSALVAGGFLVESGVKVLGIVRGNGRRSTDASVVEQPATLVELPVAREAPPASAPLVNPVAWKHGRDEGDL